MPPEISAYIQFIFERTVELGFIVMYMDDIFIKAASEKEALKPLKNGARIGKQSRITIQLGKVRHYAMP